MYNNHMMKLYAALLLSVLVSGCAFNAVYDPLQSNSTQTLLLNESGLRNVKLGMTPKEVHQVMGDELVIGYAYQNPLPGEASPLADAKVPSEKPLTIANPYKTDTRKTDRGECTVEYYVTSVKHPDGNITDDELMPLIFCGGILTDKGWDRLK